MSDTPREFNKEDRFEVLDAETGKRYGLTNMLEFAERTGRFIAREGVAGVPRPVVVRERATGAIVAEFPLDGPTSA